MRKLRKSDHQVTYCELDSSRKKSALFLMRPKLPHHEAQVEPLSAVSECQKHSRPAAGTTTESYWSVPQNRQLLVRHVSRGSLSAAPPRTGPQNTRNKKGIILHMSDNTRSSCQMRRFARV
ncbi:hypothetical protein F7725_023427 [Dissostichus mawsoni]|uniref:Uncharacterized protein n=1 Tax=Dissostichus mawsoni TaxID=36200 RepID=A0A7J5Z0N8_DISMA|nr:hypothetical protein F7725_023427 [Dissostichus mawsoni]